MQRFSLVVDNMASALMPEPRRSMRFFFFPERLDAFVRENT